MGNDFADDYKKVPEPPRRDLVWVSDVANFIQSGTMGCLVSSWQMKREMDGTYVARFRLNYEPTQQLKTAMREAAKGEAGRLTKTFILQSVSFERSRGQSEMVFTIYEKNEKQVGRKR